MSWIGVLLIGFAVADLAHSLYPVRVVPQCVGAIVAVLVGLLAGLVRTVDLVALAAIAALVLAWGFAVTDGFARRRPSRPLLVLALALGLGVLVSGAAPEVSGPFADWLDGVGLPVLSTLDPTRALLLAGLFGVQLSTGNVIVRLVLAATGTLNPARTGAHGNPSTRLKGGRLLGPMERVFILALGLAGQFTAASIVVAAKGLLRFPELQSRRDQERIHQLTEYFLVGSFVSWLVALSALVLVAR